MASPDGSHSCPPAATRARAPIRRWFATAMERLRFGRRRRTSPPQCFARSSSSTSTTSSSSLGFRAAAAAANPPRPAPAARPHPAPAPAHRAALRDRGQPSAGVMAAAEPAAMHALPQAVRRRRKSHLQYILTIFNNTLHLPFTFSATELRPRAPHAVGGEGAGRPGARLREEAREPGARRGTALSGALGRRVGQPACVSAVRLQRTLSSRGSWIGYARRLLPGRHAFKENTGTSGSFGNTSSRNMQPVAISSLQVRTRWLHHPTGFRRLQWSTEGAAVR
ncbi:uncharacterized protein BKCO1_6400042 [Diplodia corticola]|uniref:Uncharacterized protein n=1 Tax=Diplodia corticola TaxID=236234 RepID=A0A1J9RP15_9PEZI|nr:uncharacterized protein BKCO1_6400042 [Diplodia corticola]OJD30215.1 hypothetical protein BKCO1_6400042 [Diplodia corticola]